MAGKRDIKTSLKLEGEAQFKKGMTDAASAIKVLNSEQKLAAAQFEATGDAEQYAAEKTRILKEKIAEQQKAVKNAEDAVRQLKADGIDPNSKAMQTWRTKLNTAKTALTKMQTELNNTEKELGEQGDAFDDATTDAGEYRDKLDEIGKNVDFTATIQAIDNVRERLGSIITGAGRAAKAMWNLELGGAKWADELKTAADVAGMDVETYQAWQYASELVDTSVDSIIGSYKRLNKNLDEPTDDILKSLNEISVYNLDPLTGQARQTMDVFWDVVDALGEIENTSRRDQIAMELFGKSYDDLLPLIKAGSQVYKDYIEEGRLSAVSAENVEALGELDDANNRLTASFTKTKETLLANFAEPFETVADAITDALNNFNDFIESTEGQEALSGLKGALSGLADEIRGVDWQDAMNKASAVIKKITDSLTWLLSHKTVVIAAIGGMAGAWAGLRVAGDVLSVMQLLKDINWGQISKVAASGAANTAGAGTAGAEVVGAGKWISSALNMFSGPAAGIALGSLVAKLANDKATKANWSGFWEAKEKLPELLANTRQDEGGQRYQEMLEAFSNAWEKYNADKNNFDVEDPTAEIKKAFATYANDLLQAAPDLPIWDWAEYFGDKSDGLDDAEIQAILNNALNADNWINLGRDAVEKLADGLESGENLPIVSAENLTADIQTTMESVDSETIGYNTGMGLANGINESIPLAVGAAEALGNAVSAQLRSVLQVQSPSKVMEGIGRYVTEGFAKGIEENVSSVERATNRMVKATTGGAISRGEDPVAARGSGMVHVTLVMDGQQVADIITPYVDSNIGASIARRR